MILPFRDCFEVNKMWSYVFCFFVFLLVLAVFDWIRLKLRHRKYMVNIPGPRNLPLVGVMLEFPSFEGRIFFAFCKIVKLKSIFFYGILIKKKKNPVSFRILEALSIGEKFSSIYGPVVRGNLSFLEMLLIHDERWIEFFMNSTKTLKKSSEYKLLENWLGEGLLTSAGVWGKEILNKNL